MMNHWRTGGRLALLAGVTQILVLTSGIAMPVSAAEREVEFDIPRGSLGAVINAIALAGGQPIAFPAGLAAGRASGPIAGRKSVRQALAQALSGTNLAIAGAEGGYTVEAVRQTSAIKAGDADVDIGDVDVTDDRGRDRGFAASNSGSSTRIDAPLKEIPQSITAVTKDALDKQATTSAYQAALNVSSVTVTPSTGSSAALEYSVRGISNNQVLVGGAITQGVNIPIADIERVDVLKGPTSILSGTALPGGAINVVTKQPTSVPIRTVTAYVGSYGYKTLAFDLGGPVPEMEGVTYRFNTSGNFSDESYGGYRYPHEFLVSPIATWQDSDTRLTAGVRFVNTRFAAAPFTIFTTDDTFQRPFHTDRSIPIGNPNARGIVTTVQPLLEASHNFGNVSLGDMLGTLDFAVNSKTQYTQNETTLHNIGAVGAFSNYAILNSAYTKSSTKLLTTQEDLTIKHHSDSVNQTIRFGFDYIKNDTSTVTSLNALGGLQTTLTDIRDPIRDFALHQPVDIPATTTQSDDVGLSFQDKIDIFDRLHILGAVRKDYYYADAYTNYRLIGTSQSTKSQPVSYSAGAAFDFLPWFTVYGSNSLGFVPQTATLATGGIAPPLITANSEIGTKLSLFDNQLNLTGALYNLSQSNSIINTGLGSIVGPGFDSKGVEFDVQGQITPNLSVIASASFAQYKYLDPSQASQKVTAQPAVTASIYGNYAFLDGIMNGFYLGAGARGTTHSYSFFSGTTYFKVPGYGVVDLYAGYRKENTEINLRVANVLDHYYYLATSTFLYVPIGEGRSFTLTLRQAF